MNCFIEIHPKFFLRFHSRCERAFPPFHLVDCLLCPEFVVYDP
jgi:hypothetical protein